MSFDVLLANPRGFCAGVDRAIEIVDRALQQLGAPIYVRHEVVHNKFVVEDLRAKGAVFIEDLADVPPGATLIFSAHGVSQAVRNEAAERGFKVFDATCPLVTKVHIEVTRHCRAGRDVVLIGHAGHVEVEGTMGQWRKEAGTGSIYLVEDVEQAERIVIGQPDNVAFTTQTTLSVDDTKDIIATLQRRFPAMQGPRHDDICYATQNRQDAVKVLAAKCDLVIVVGSQNSSNSRRLREVAAGLGVDAYLVDAADEIRPEWLAGKQRVGVTAGASAPEHIVADVVTRLQVLGQGVRIDLQGVPEDVNFPLPRELV